MRWKGHRGDIAAATSSINLSHWDRVTHICVSKITIIGSDNGLSPGRRQAIIWTNGGILLIEPLGTNFSETLIAIYTFPFKKIHLKMSSGKWRPSCLGLNVLKLIMVTTSSATSDRKAVTMMTYRNSLQQWCQTPHYSDVIMGTIAPQITSLTIVDSIVYSDADQRKYQSSASPAFVRGVHRGPVNFPHKWPVTRKMIQFDDVIMTMWKNIAYT